MKNKLLLLVIILFIGVQINGQTTKNEKPAYLIFDSKGELVDFSSLISDISNADICLFGELHNDPISHWLEIELIKEFNLAKNKQLIVGAEMWERDNQHLFINFMMKPCTLSHQNCGQIQNQTIYQFYNIVLKII